MLKSTHTKKRVDDRTTEKSIFRAAHPGSDDENDLQTINIRQSNDNLKDDSNQKKRHKMKYILTHWKKDGKEFLIAQGQVLVVLLIAYIGNNWPKAYPRNDNHNMPMFWIMNAAIVVAAIFSLKHDANGSARGVQLLSRPQTEEWKGWMQWAFIMVGASVVAAFQ